MKTVGVEDIVEDYASLSSKMDLFSCLGCLGMKRGYGRLNELQKKEPPVAQNWSFTRLRPTPPWQPNFNRLKAGEDFVTSPRTMRRLVSSKRLNKARSKSEDDSLDAYTPSRRDMNTRRDTISKKDNTLKRDMSNASQISGDTSILEEDMMILSVIEAYCFSARQRQTMNLEDQMCDNRTNDKAKLIGRPIAEIEDDAAERKRKGKISKIAGSCFLGCGLAKPKSLSLQ